MLCPSTAHWQSRATPDPRQLTPQPTPIIVLQRDLFRKEPSQPVLACHVYPFSSLTMLYKLQRISLWEEQAILLSTRDMSLSIRDIFSLHSTQPGSCFKFFNRNVYINWRFQPDLDGCVAKLINLKSNVNNWKCCVCNYSWSLVMDGPKLIT